MSGTELPLLGKLPSSLSCGGRPVSRSLTPSVIAPQYPSSTLPWYQVICKMPWKPLLGYFLQSHANSLRMRLMFTEKAEAWKRPIVCQLMPKPKLRYLQGLWPHLVPGYFFTIFSVSKLSLPGTLILTHVSISSDPFW